MRRAQTKRGSIFIRVLIAAVIVIGFCGGGILALRHMFSGFTLFEVNETTEKDYPTNSERLQFINGLTKVMPVTFPASTTVIQFRYGGFQDHYLYADIQIPIAEIEPFILANPILKEDAPGIYKGNNGSNWFTIEIDPATGDMHIELYNT